MILEDELEEKILERICLIQANVKNGAFGFEEDGSFKLLLDKLDDEINQIKAKIKEQYECI